MSITMSDDGGVERYVSTWRRQKRNMSSNSDNSGGYLTVIEGVYLISSFPQVE